MKYIIVIAILVVIIGGGLWFSLRQTPKEIVIPQEIELSEDNNIKKNEIADWETYSDSDLGFSFRYPLQWGMPQRDILSTRTEISFGTKLIISTGIYYNQDLMRNMTVEELVGTYKNYKDFKQEEILVGGREATKVSYTSGNNDKIIEVFVAHNDRIILISSDIAIDNLFDQILSTFRFVETVMVSKYIRNSFNLTDKTFEVITAEEKTIKVSVTDNTKFHYKVSLGDQSGSMITEYKNFFQFVEGRRDAYDGEHAIGGFDETIRGIFLNDTLMEADEIFWWAQ